MADVRKKLSKCVKRRERVFVRLQLCFDLIKELPGKKNVFTARCSELSQLYNDFEDISQEIDDLNEKVDDTSDVIDTAAPSKQFDIMYYEIKSAYELILVDQNLVPKSQEKCETVVKPKLPQIDISKFGGQLDQFTSFKSLFDNLIHSSSIAPIEKFSYLRSLLEGPALSVIEGIPFDPDHYKLAYDTLVERYTNPRILASHYLNKILDQQPIKHPSLNSLRHITDLFNINIQALKALKIDDMSGFVFLQLALRLLDNNTRKAFELENKSVKFPTIENLMSFLRAQCSVYELTKDSAKHVTTVKHLMSTPHKVLMSTQPKSDGTQSTPLQAPSSLICPMCKDNHQLFRCEQFIALKPGDRFNMTRSFKRCFACLGTHILSACSSTSSCRHCKSKKHHSLLHEDKMQKPNCNNTSAAPKVNDNNSTAKPVMIPAISEKPAQSLSCSLNRKTNHNMVILSTAQVLIKDSFGNWQNCRLVIDGGSEVNFITRSLAQSLNLPLEKCSVDIIGIGHSSNITAKNIVSCNIASRYQQNDSLQLEAVVIPQIASDLPATPIQDSIKKKFSHFLLADPDFNCPGKVDMLLGAQAFTDIMTDKFPLIKGQPSALHTIFGWVLMGNVSSDLPVKQTNSLFVSLKTDQLLQRFWELEEINLPKPPSLEDQACEDHFRSTIHRDETGRYVASLPFKDGKPPDLGSTREVALRKYHSLETKFSSNPKLNEEYKHCLQDYVDQEHMALATKTTPYVLTHHCVIKKSSTSSPLRIVFNASELSNTNQSLNKSLMVGPKLQADIGNVITNFRLHRIALTCDIKQMYRAIRLSDEDCKYQHIFWRTDPSGPIQEWELRRLTFGVSCSPFIAQRTLKQLVIEEGSKFPKAAKALNNSIYIDDLVCGTASVSEAHDLYNELTQMLKSGGFELHKWASSNDEVLKSIPESHRETPHSLGSTKSIKILGIEWNPSTDCFRYSISPIDRTPTKRNVLSHVARIYDVNGYISPVVFTLKHLLQDIWVNKLNWDDTLPSELEDKWNKITQEIPLLSELSIPRNILSTYIYTQIIGFSDASKIGMCATLYLRVKCNDYNIECNLIQSKTKVAPLKALTIPSLELCAALLLAHLLKANDQLINKLRIKKVYLFSDSMNVLSWIKTSPHLLETFIANRVCKILETTSADSWYHIPGDLNPADCGTRDIMPSKLINLIFWWHGPPFLSEDESTWPINFNMFPHNIPEFKLEMSQHVLTAHSVPQNDLYDCMTRYSTLTKLQNVLGYVLRFINNIRRKKDNRCGSLSVTERNESLKLCIKIVQNHHYSKDIRLINQGKQCSPALKTLSPFLSQDTLMVGGRLRFSPLPESAKHPYLIPPKSHLAALLCDHYHIQSLHGGPKLVQSLIQRRFWIPGARNLIRKRIFKCLLCYKLKAKPLQPYMADIPPSRFMQGRAFANVGLDFAGPFLVKESIRRNARLSKCYVALFVCMSVKAIHLELVHSLTTESCLAAIDRFIARRGLPQNIYSDQGRNFIGAARQLHEVYDLLKNSNKQFSEHLAKLEITWNFNPPYAANFGGLWEAGVKSTKHHLKRILETHHFTAEEFHTFLCRIEAVLNSRPLCPLSNSPDDGFDYLSPGHFIVGGQLLSRPEEDVTNEPPHILTRWKLINKASQIFWKSWSKDYIHSQIQRPKWTTKTSNVKEGDLCLMYYPNLPPLSWPLGRIVSILPGKDDVVRVVQVKTSQGVFTRPVNKLVALPTN